MPAPLPAPTADLDWSIGDAVIAAIAAGAQPDTAKRDAARQSRNEPSEITWIVRTCEAFPAGRRRTDAPFALHRAVLDLDDTDRDAMLAQAIAEGWTIRRTRRAVLEARVAAGVYCPPVEDDLDDKLYRGIVQAWNRATPGARDLFMGSAEEADMAEIML